jgi:membrane fusion protein (multidrug efflux system)
LEQVMRAVWNIFIVLALMAGAGAVGFFIGHRAAAPVETDDPDVDSIEPTPMVQTVPIRQGRIDRTITAYGVVTAQSGDVEVLSVAFESRVKKILVVAGQRLDGDEPVIELEPSADTRLAMLQAKSAVESARTDLEQTRRRFDDHLATNQDLLQSEQNLQLAQLKLGSLQSEGAGGSVQLKGSGLVDKVDVQEGQVVPAGGALVEISAGRELQVRLGVEPSDAADIHVGDSVALQMIHSNAPAAGGKVRMIGRRIDPDSHLAEVLVSIPADAALPLDAYVRGELTIAGVDGLVVPRSAVLPDDEGFSMFTVDQGKAVEHKVSIAGEDDQSAEITGEGLAEGEAVVAVGNLELEDGMSVKVEQASTEPAATGPAAPGPAATGSAATGPAGSGPVSQEAAP